MSPSFTAMSRHPHMAEPNHARSANYQLTGGRTVSGETLARLLANDGSATAAVASLMVKGENAPAWLKEMAAAEIVGGAAGVPDWMQP